MLPLEAKPHLLFITAPQQPVDVFVSPCDVDGHVSQSVRSTFPHFQPVPLSTPTLRLPNGSGRCQASVVLGLWDQVLCQHGLAVPASCRQISPSGPTEPEPAVPVPISLLWLVLSLTRWVKPS